MAVSIQTEKDVYRILARVKDPEIPVVDVVGMGMIRQVSLDGENLEVTLTPTYSGCPAMEVIQAEILETLQRSGFKKVALKTAYAPPWTTDWIDEETKRKLRQYGIAPPEKTTCSSRNPGQEPQTDCPYCHSPETELRSLFGSTACKSLHYCHGCQQPFESFKCI